MKAIILLVVFCAIILGSCSNEPRSAERNVARNDRQEWPRIQRRDNTIVITTASGQNVTVYYGNRVTAVDISLATGNDSLSKNNGLFLDFTESHLRRTGMMIGDREGVQEYLVLSPKEIKKIKYMNSSEIRDMKIAIPELVPPAK